MGTGRAAGRSLSHPGQSIAAATGWSLGHIICLQLRGERLHLNPLLFLQPRHRSPLRPHPNPAHHSTYPGCHLVPPALFQNLPLFQGPSYLPQSNSPTYPCSTQTVPFPSRSVSSSVEEDTLWIVGGSCAIVCKGQSSLAWGYFSTMTSISLISLQDNFTLFCRL